MFFGPENNESVVPQRCRLPFFDVDFDSCFFICSVIFGLLVNSVYLLPLPISVLLFCFHLDDLETLPYVIGSFSTFFSFILFLQFTMGLVFSLISFYNKNGALLGALVYL